MRILVLSADAGKTFSSVSQAVTEQLTGMNVDYDLVDALIMIPAKGDALARWGRSRPYHLISRVLGHAYSYEEGHMAKFFYDECANGAEALHSELEKEHYDAVICLHIFACMMMTEVRRRFGATVPCYFVATDYTCVPGVSEVKADGFFIPHRLLFADFVRCGIPADRMYATGIPVRADFYPSAEDLSETRRRLNLPDACKAVFLRAGNMESGKTFHRIRKLLSALPPQTILFVHCGKNQKLLKKLTSLGSDRLRALDSEAPIRDFLSVSDVCVGKPRGLPVTEAMVCGVPNVLFRELPGCETRNFEFLVGRDAASGSRYWGGVISCVLELLRNPDAVRRQRDAMASLLPQNAAEQICRTVYAKTLKS